VVRFPFLTQDRLLAEYERAPLLRMATYVLSGIVAACRMISAQPSDLIHGHWVIPAGMMAAIAGRLTHRPVVLSAHGSDVFVWAAKHGFSALARATLKQALLCSANSRPVRDRLIELGMPPSRVPVIYETGVDPFRFRPDLDGGGVRKSIGLTCNHFVLLFLGNLTKGKGVDVLLTALSTVTRAHPELRAIIAGGGPEREPLEQLASTLAIQDSVHFVGPVEPDQTHTLFAACDAFVLPSRSEGMGIVILEAMASGRPIIASEVGGVPDLIIDGTTGLLCPPDDSRALAGRISELMSDEQLRCRLARSARQEAESRFAESLQVDRVLDMYRKASTPILAEFYPHHGLTTIGD
jgi:glycosyltransferase involved in cell wall biosynthesis